MDTPFDSTELHQDTQKVRKVSLESEAFESDNSSAICGQREGKQVNEGIDFAIASASVIVNNLKGDKEYGNQKKVKFMLGEQTNDPTTSDDAHGKLPYKKRKCMPDTNDWAAVTINRYMSIAQDTIQGLQKKHTYHPMTAQQIIKASEYNAKLIATHLPEEVLLCLGLSSTSNEMDGEDTYSGSNAMPSPSPEQIKHFIDVQTEAFIESHFQQQILSGIYLGDERDGRLIHPKSLGRKKG